MSMNNLRCGLLAALALCAAACGGPTPDEAGTADDAIEAGTARALPLSTDGATRAQGGNLVYYGGPVLAHTKVVVVLWGAVDPEVASRLSPFYRAALYSSYYDWLSEYDTTVKAVDGSPGTGQQIRRGSFAGAVHIAPRANHAQLTDAQIQKELAAQVRAGKLPRPDADTVFMLHFPPGLQISLDGTGSCESGGFCGYHNAFRVRGQRIAYAVLPDMGAGSGCDTGCGSGSAVDRVTAVASHELTEATTDPEVGLTQQLAAPLAWYDPARGEIGDLCNGKTGKLRVSGATFVVQKEWSNAARACVLGGKANKDELDLDPAR
jgi:hypothetical protein